MSNPIVRYIQKQLFAQKGAIANRKAVDFSAAKMGRIIRAQELWIISDIDYLYSNFGTENARPIKEIGTKELQSLYNQNIFQEGTIKPKIKAALHFLKHHGDKVVITSIDKIKLAIEKKSGTIIRN